MQAHKATNKAPWSGYTYHLNTNSLEQARTYTHCLSLQYAIADMILYDSIFPKHLLAETAIIVTETHITHSKPHIDTPSRQWCAADGTLQNIQFLN